MQDTICAVIVGTVWSEPKLNDQAGRRPHTDFFMTSSRVSTRNGWESIPISAKAYGSIGGEILQKVHKLDRILVVGTFVPGIRNANGKQEGIIYLTLTKWMPDPVQKAVDDAALEAAEGRKKTKAKTETTEEGTGVNDEMLF